MQSSDFPLKIKTPQIMGILNVTEDSFSDGGMYLDPAKAFLQAQKMIHEGADIIDIGGESTRPGSARISEEKELSRIIPILKRIRTSYPDIVISIDTYKSRVAQEAINLGVQIINDISALRFDPRMPEVLASNPEVKLIMMHMLGEPETMQSEPRYQNIIAEINTFFTERISYANSHGIDSSRIMLDPGIGFGKNLQHNLTLFRHFDSFAVHGLPLVLAASRKRFINELNESNTEERIGGSIATSLIAALHSVDIIRVHDVKAHKQFFAVLQAVMGEGI